MHVSLVYTAVPTPGKRSRALQHPGPAWCAASTGVYQQLHNSSISHAWSLYHSHFAQRKKERGVRYPGIGSTVLLWHLLNMSHAHHLTLKEGSKNPRWPIGPKRRPASCKVFELGEVTGATDFTGKSVESDTVRAFLQNVQDTGRYAKGFECSDLEEADPDAWFAGREPCNGSYCPVKASDSPCHSVRTFGMQHARTLVS